MTETIDVVVTPAAVELDAPCYRCGYNVRGLAGDGLCPECGAPVDESVRRHAADVAGRPLPLHESDPRWLRRLAWGCALVFFGGLGTAGMQAMSLAELEIPQALRMAVFFITFVVPAGAAWVVASREPVHAGRRRVWLRVLIRASIVCWVLAMLIVLATLLSGSWAYLRQTFLAGGVASGVLSWAFFWRLRDVAARFEGRRPRRACTALAFLTAAACLAASVPGVGEIETGPSTIQMLAAQPIVAHPSLLPTLPLSLATVPRLDPLVAAHTLMTLTSLAALVALATFHVALRRAANRSAAVERSGRGEGAARD